MVHAQHLQRGDFPNSAENIPSFDDLLTDVRNIYNSLYWELAWKNHSLKTEHWYLKALSTNGEDARRICGQYMIDFALCFAEQHARKPVILDVGCGPISSLAVLAYEDLATVIGVDPIAEEYQALLERYDIESPVAQRYGPGELLNEIDLGHDFDAVFSRNALDHNQCPSLTWLHMFNLIPAGGYMIQSHSIREARKEQWKQLHQFNLYPDEAGHLWIEDKYGMAISLTSDLPLQVALNEQKHNPDGSGWFTSMYWKVDGEPSNAFMHNVIVQLQFAFANRSNWAFQLERKIFSETAEGDPKKSPFDLRIKSDRA